MNGRFVWHDLMTTDLETAKAFYTGLFGWNVNVMDMGEHGSYTILENGGNGFGGCVQTDPAYGIPPHWSSYLQVVGTVDEACAKIVAAGGSVMQPAMDVPDIGRMAFTIDPQGAHINPFNAALSDTPPPPPGYSGARGGVTWVELMTKDTATAAAFYCDLTGWTSTVADMGTGPYTLLQDGSTMLAGIMDLPEGVSQPAWTVYFEITQETMEQALAEVKRLGGVVAMGPMEIPTVGVIAAVADPTGAMFNLMKSAS